MKVTYHNLSLHLGLRLSFGILGRNCLILAKDFKLYEKADTASITFLPLNQSSHLAVKASKHRMFFIIDPLILNLKLLVLISAREQHLLSANKPQWGWKASQKISDPLCWLWQDIKSCVPVTSWILSVSYLFIYPFILGFTERCESIFCACMHTLLFLIVKTPQAKAWLSGCSLQVHFK